MKTSITLVILLTIILLLTCLLFPDLLSAQGQGQGSPPPPGNPTATPIDGGLALLAAAGGAYAYKKLRKKD